MARINLTYQGEKNNAAVMKAVLSLNRYCTCGPMATEGETVAVPIRLSTYTGTVRMHRAKRHTPGTVHVESSSTAFALLVLNALRQMLEAQGVPVQSDVLASLNPEYALHRLKKEDVK